MEVVNLDLFLAQCLHQKDVVHMPWQDADIVNVLWDCTITTSYASAHFGNVEM